MGRGAGGGILKSHESQNYTGIIANYKTVSAETYPKEANAMTIQGLISGLEKLE